MRDVPPLDPGTLVWMPDRESEGIVTEEVAPRSYTVETQEDTYRRNSLLKLLETGETIVETTANQNNRLEPFEGVIENGEKLTDSTLHGIELIEN